jgi:hypothetical protein
MMLSRELDRLREAISEQTLKSDGDRSIVAVGLGIAVLLSLLARYWPPMHDSLGLDALTLVLAVCGLATATSVATWRLVAKGLLGHARALQPLDFCLWDLAPVAVAYSCSQPWGVLIALVFHGGMTCYHARICRRSWIMRASVMVTWVPIFYLASEYAWIGALAVFTLGLFFIVNLATHIRRCDEEAREERMRRDYKALSRSFSRLVKRAWPEDDR